MAAGLVKVASNCGMSLQPVLQLHDLATAVQGKKPKRHRPLTPEFHRIAKRPKGKQLPEGTKSLPPHLGGIWREEEKLNRADEMAIEDHAKFVKVGYHRPP